MRRAICPPLKTKIEHVEQYDMLFLGFPTWDMQLPLRWFDSGAAGPQCTTRRLLLRFGNFGRRY